MKSFFKQREFTLLLLLNPLNSNRTLYVRKDPSSFGKLSLQFWDSLDCLSAFYMK